MTPTDWASTEGLLAEFVRQETNRNIAAFAAQPRLLREQANIEQTVVEGGYSKKQINELVQNAADAMEGLEGRAEVVLTHSHLYCANEGMPLRESGISALLMSHSSDKTGNEIGRFGLGFKSVLAVTRAPEIFSRSVSFRWDTEHIRNRLEAQDVQSVDIPVLRAAVPVDPTESAKSDPVLEELMDWASTVVRLPLLPHIDWLWPAMKDFPGEFLLFSDKVGTLILSNRASGERISWRADRDDNGMVTLTHGEQSTEWQVFSAHHEPSESAKIEAGHLSARDDLTVSWAVPRKRRNRRGQLWTFFPTTSETSLTGIINAPFKMNEDRHNVLSGQYNKEILTRTLPRVVAAALPSLVDDEDPGSILELLPARGREAQSWADETLNQAVMDVVSRCQVVPDMAEEVQFLHDLHVPELTAFGDDEQLVKEWYAQAADQGVSNWVHPSCINHKDRNATLSRLLGARNVGRKNVQTWLEVLAAADDFDALESLLRLARMIEQHYPDHRAAMRQSRIVLDAAGRLRPPITSEMSLPAGTLSEESGNTGVIHPDLVAHGSVRQHLMALGFENPDAIGQLKMQLAVVKRSGGDPDEVESAWRISRNIRETGHIAGLFADLPRKFLLVRCMDGQWRQIDHVWLRGGLFPSGHVLDAELLVDDRFHRHDLKVLRRLDVKDSLAQEVRTNDSKDPTYNSWARAVTNTLVAELRADGVPVAAHHVSLAAVNLTPGLEGLQEASRDIRAKITEILLGRPHFPTSPTIGGNYDPAVKDVDQPDLWWIRQHGILRTPYGLLPTGECVGDVEGLSTEFLPSPMDQRALRLLPLPIGVDQIEWPRLLDQAARALPIGAYHELLAEAAQQGVAPPHLIAMEHGGSKNLTELQGCSVTSSERTREHLLSVGERRVVFVKSASQAESLAENWGLTLREISFSTIEDFVATGPAELITDSLPHLPEVVKGVTRLRVQWCKQLTLVETNDFDERRTYTELSERLNLDSRTLYIRGTKDVDRMLESLVRQKGLRRTALEIKMEHAEIEQRESLTSRPLDELLVQLLGREALHKLVNPAILSMVESVKQDPLTSQELFEVARSIHGLDLVNEIRKNFTGLSEDGADLAAMGPPIWSFLQKLVGAPAGTKPSPPLPREEVLGPVVLNPLHGYQEDAGRKIRDLLHGDSPHRRGLLMLPTGAGKTRTMTESLVRHVVEAEENVVIMWLAQSTELCEQAIESWKYVWQAIGAAGARMAVSRFWGGMADPTAEDVKLHLVVGTPNTTLRVVESASRYGDYSWLFNADILVLDEAHSTMNPSYTKILDAFGRGHHQRSRLMLGMSATPFKGTSEERTKQLVNRFDGNLIQPSQFTSATAHEYLQDLGVLSRVRHEMIDGMELRPKRSRGTDGTDDNSVYALKESQLDLQAVAANEQRNRALIEDILNRGPGSSAIVFAASVDHARALAATLNYMGVKSASISADTSGAARRAAIEDFRRGEIRVLANYDVLSEGFDAPGVDTVYVARPTFSPNVYLQMVGRGLRGPKNGGSEWTTIVNVRDNVEQFGTALAFGHFDHLWTQHDASGEPSEEEGSETRAVVPQTS